MKSAFFCNFAAQFIKSCVCMIIKDKRIITMDIPVRNWGYLENWKSTASVYGSRTGKFSSVVYLF